MIKALTLPLPLPLRVQGLEAAFRRIERERMAGLPLMHPRLRVQAVGFAAGDDGLALGVLVTPWFMNLVRLPLSAQAADLLPRPGGEAGEECTVFGWRFLFHTQHEDGVGRFAAASLVSPMSEFADQAAAVATAQALLEHLRPPPPRRRFFTGRGAALPAPTGPA
ncbi:[NiFe]-hydrogenase assembly chaperone HybE [Pseudorhodoferax sp.]|uniref:[NiFe]-hydrogenase assembly chaperone HybE n=1 Tax=Pseudorhodoferax sp. TaxID=1993553 RepID=UPI002DD61B85|nr:[NiFe]-hydrogenase assembly chaperone HybE [Pseudorhodoferax sp.]